VRRVYHCPGCSAELVYDPDEDQLERRPVEPECRCGHDRSEHVPEWGCTYWNCDCQRFAHRHRSMAAVARAARTIQEAT
jgi:hypothetical protein